ncbi:MAG: hypothetical protein NUV81_01830 [bacterium]|nr:hypothetical protein [bacterium]
MAFLQSAANRVRRPRRWAVAILSVMILGALNGARSYISMISSVSETDIQAQAYGPIMDWFREHTEPDQVIYANDEISNLIPVYTSANVFFSGNAGLSLISDREMIRRFAYNHYFSSFTSEMIEAYERSIFGFRYVALAGKLRQQNVLRRAFGVAPITFEAFPKEAMAEAVRQAKEIQASDIRSMWREYHIDYILWDTEANPEWGFRDHSSLILVYQDERFIIYKIL